MVKENYYDKLKKRLVEVSKLKVPITNHDLKKYFDVFEDNPSSFRYNCTKLFYDHMKNHISNGKVWRINLSGKTRHGKSEVAQSWTMFYIDEFNNALKTGAYDDLEKQGVNYNKKRLSKLKAEQILFSKSNYLYVLREQQKNDKLVYGNPCIVDEDQQSIGGLGSYSERLELDNINNITAQALQSEWQLRPDKFVLKNAPFGLFQEKMDRVNKVNWSMLYEFKTDPTRTKDFIFIGWVATPLHFDDKLRVEYNKIKKQNILNVINGTADLRLLERVKVAKDLASDVLFSMRSTNGKTFKLSKQQREGVLNEWIIDGKCQNFNSIEKQEIVEHATMVCERDYVNKMNDGGVAK